MLVDGQTFFHNLCSIYELVQRKSLKEKASKGKGEVVLCIIKHYAMKLYGEIIAACILIILAMHEGQ